MTDPIKTIRLLLKPVFTGDKVTSISGRTILSIPSITAGKCVVGLYTKHGPIATQCYDNLIAEDESGPLKLTWQDIGAKKNIRQWCADHDSVGDIVVHWEAFPRVVTSKTTAGPRTDTRTDQGGIQSCMVSIAPVPWGQSEISTETYRKIIEWDLSESLPGTRAVSGYGEGPQPLERIGSLKDILPLFLMVGPIRSYPPASNLTEASHFGYYWLGDDTPSRIADLGPFLAGMFQKMSDFFQDPPSKTNGYRIFVRCATPAQAHGGAAGKRNFLLEYNDTLPSMPPEGVMYLLSHEMVHNWPILDSIPFGTDPNDLVDWFNEGIADFYGSTLPYRFGLATRSSYLNQMNAILTAYYTNPLRDISDKEAIEQKFENSNALEVPYKRGFTFFCCLDREIRRIGRGKSLDDLIVDISQRRMKGEPHGLPVFLDMIKDVAPDMIQVFHDMQSGKLIIPPSDSFGSDFESVAGSQENFDLGFNESSITSRVITGLSDDHRAKDTGIMEGDEILKNTFLWQCRGSLDQQMVMKLKRDDKELEITYWPRSYKKVESWQFREKTGRLI